MINFEATRSAKENEDAMVESLSTVATGQLTYAVRDTSIDGKEIKNGDIMGLGDSGLLADWEKDDKVASSFCRKTEYDLYDAHPFVSSL